MLASLLIGFVSGKFASSSNAYLFLAVGICGGWSTFSSFSLDNFILMNEGKIGMALVNISMSVIACYFFLWLGIYLAKNS